MDNSRNKTPLDSASGALRVLMMFFGWGADAITYLGGLPVLVDKIAPDAISNYLDLKPLLVTVLLGLFSAVAFFLWALHVSRWTYFKFYGAVSAPSNVRSLKLSTTLFPWLITLVLWWGATSTIYWQSGRPFDGARAGALIAGTAAGGLALGLAIAFLADQAARLSVGPPPPQR